MEENKKDDERIFDPDRPSCDNLKCSDWGKRTMCFSGVYLYCEKYERIKVEPLE